MAELIGRMLPPMTYYGMEKPVLTFEVDADASWKRMGLGWQTDTFPSKIDGCTNVALYYGSSTYDVPTMSRLIDNIVQDCKALGIETKSSEELESLLGEWGR